MNKTLQRGEDPSIDNLMRTLGGMAELCLPSILAILVQWVENQEKTISQQLTSA